MGYRKAESFYLIIRLNMQVISSICKRNSHIYIFKM